MSKDPVADAQLKQVVALSLGNIPEYKIAEQLQMTRYAVRKMRNSLEFRNELKEIGDQAVATAKESFKSKLDELAPLALAALKKNLEDGKIDAVRVFVEVVGLKEKQAEEKQEATIQIVMPGASSPTTIDVSSEVSDSSSD